jgi:hypothetical protein
MLLLEEFKHDLFLNLLNNYYNNITTVEANWI